MRMYAFAAAAAVALVAGCGQDAADESDSETVSMSVEITGTSDALAVEYEAENVGEESAVLYNVLQPANDYDGDRATVRVEETDDTVEIAHKIDHPCQDDPDEQHCPDSAEAVDYEIGGTVLAPSEVHAQTLEFPARGEPGFIETAGKDVTFCLGYGVHDEDNPEPDDGKYGAASPQTVVCSDPTRLD